MKSSEITLWPKRIGLSFLFIWAVFSIFLFFNDWEVGKWWLLILITAAIYFLPFITTYAIVKLFRFIKKKGNKP